MLFVERRRLNRGSWYSCLILLVCWVRLVVPPRRGDALSAEAMMSLRGGKVLPPRREKFFRVVNGEVG